MSTKIKILSLIIFSIPFLYSFLLSLPVSAATNYEAIYNRMTSRLPDDDYDLITSSGNVAQGGSQCPENQRCTTDHYTFLGKGDRSHQTITLGNKSINDDSQDRTRPFPFAYEQEFVIYTRTKGPKNLRLEVRNRAIGEDLSCGNKIIAEYYTGRGNVRVGSASVKTDSTDCQHGYDFEHFPGEGFVPIEGTEYNGKPIYKGKILLKFVPRQADNGKRYQTSFHLFAPSDAKLGYMGENDPDGPISDNVTHAWIHQYPTNLANGHKLTWYFRPTCDTKAGKDMELAWDDLNYGTSIQPNKPRATLYKFIPGQIETAQKVMQIDHPNGIGIRTANVELIPDGEYKGTPYAYMFQFEGVHGGNGIDFKSPYDSGDARIPCPPKKTGEAKAECSYLQIDLQPHTVYRFSAFSRDGRYLKDTPVPVSGDFYTFHFSTPQDTNKDANKNVRWASYHQSPEQSHVEENSSNSINKYQLNYSISGPDRVVYIEAWTKDQVTKKWTYAINDPPIVTKGCSNDADAAKCEIEIYGNVTGKESAAKANSQFLVRVKLTSNNGGEIPLDFEGTRLGVTSHKDSAFPINRGEENVSIATVDGSFTATFTLTAPDKIDNHLLKVYPDYYGKKSFGDPCEKRVSVYKGFNIDLSAETKMSPNDENPTDVNYRAWVTNANGPEVQVPTSSRFYRTNGGVNRVETGGSYPKGETDTIKGTHNPTSAAAGDNYCTELRADFTAGFRGPGGPGDVVKDPDAPQAPPAESCRKVHNAPYFHVFNSDVSAGGGFDGGTCNNPGGIYTYLKTAGTRPSGSGVQIGALALSKINGFSSAILRNDAPTGSTGLSFANTVNISGEGQGGMLGDPHCVPDYFAGAAKARLTPDTAPAKISLSGLSGAKYYAPASGTLEIEGGNISSGSSTKAAPHTTIYVKGNVRITENVTYQNTDDWTNPEWIPSVRVIVYGGSITIDNNVTQLDGMYVSQPNRDDNTGGVIYTCQTGTDKIYSNVLNQCNNQLVVNGAFVSKQIYLLRSFGSLRDSISGERFGNGSRTCSRQTGTAGTDRNDCAAEIFNFAPEMYLSQFFTGAGDEQPTTGPGMYNYDYITSLSPVL